MSENKCKWKEKKMSKLFIHGSSIFPLFYPKFYLQNRYSACTLCRRLQAYSVAGASVTFSHTSGIVTSHKCQSYTYIASLRFSVGYELRTKKMQAIHT